MSEILALKDVIMELRRQLPADVVFSVELGQELFQSTSLIATKIISIDTQVPDSSNLPLSFFFFFEFDRVFFPCFYFEKFGTEHDSVFCRIIRFSRSGRCSKSTSRGVLIRFHFLNARLRNWNLTGSWLDAEVLEKMLFWMTKFRNVIKKNSTTLNLKGTEIFEGSSNW